VVLLYLILVDNSAPSRSVHHLVALPPDTGVLVALLLWGTTLNVMSADGVGCWLALHCEQHSDRRIAAPSHQGRQTKAHEAIFTSCRVPAAADPVNLVGTVIGLLPNGTEVRKGSESYAPLAQALIC